MQLDQPRGRVAAEESAQNGRRLANQAKGLPENPRAVDVALRLGEVRVIEEIEELRANAEMKVFANIELLGNAQIGIEVAGPAILVPVLGGERVE